MLVLRAVCFRVGGMVPNGLEAGDGVRKDAHPVVCSEFLLGRMNGHQLRPHDGAGLVCATCIDVDGGASRNMYHRIP